MQARNTLSSRASWPCRHLDFSQQTPVCPHFTKEDDKRLTLALPEFIHVSDSGGQGFITECRFGKSGLGSGSLLFQWVGRQGLEPRALVVIPVSILGLDNPKEPGASGGIPQGGTRDPGLENGIYHLIGQGKIIKA